MTMNSKLLDRFEGLASLIGNTPMLEISLKYRGEFRKVYAKAEYYNYTGSIKDRITLHVMRQAYENGLIQEGCHIAEASSGNTGISFAAIGACLGNPVSIFMPDWVSKERKDIIRSFGADIRSISEEDGGFMACIELADIVGAKCRGFLPHQFSNPENAKAHYLSTGQEIISQIARLDKRIDGFVSGVGTGGTLMGVMQAIKEVYPNSKAFPIDPASSPILSSDGKVYGAHRITGIGDDFIPEIVRLDQLDEVILVDDGDAINMSRKLAKVLGLGVGISSGANFLGALKAQDILKNKDATVITVFADDNKKYLSTDLMDDQPVKSDHISNDVELIELKSIR
jgi:cysteine synthase